MDITFHGAVRTVTGSQHLLSVNGYQILLDCGLFQGSRRATYERNITLPFDASQIDVLILSHAHIDHSGNLPNLKNYCPEFVQTSFCDAPRGARPPGGPRRDA